MTAPQEPSIETEIGSGLKMNVQQKLKEQKCPTTAKEEGERQRNQIEALVELRRQRRGRVG